MMVVDSKPIFKMIKVICLIMPIFSLFYITGFNESLSIASLNSNILEQQPTLAIVLLISMICPYIAYILNLTENQVLPSNFKYGMLNILLLFIACLFMKNIVLCIGFSLGIYSVLKKESIKLDQLFAMLKQLKFSEVLKEAGGSLIILVLSMICLFAMIRLGI